MKKFFRLTWAACLVSAMASGDGPPAPESGAYLGPELGTNFLTFAWPGGSSVGTQLSPSLRLSLFSPKLMIGADLGLSTSVSPFGGLSRISLDLGGELMPYVRSWGSTRAYGLGGLNLGMELESVSGFSVLLPKAGFTLGGGIQHFFTPDYGEYGIGAEAGLRTQFLFGGMVEPTTSLYISVIGLWDPWTRTRQKVPGGPAVATAAPPEKQGTAQTPPEKPIAYGHSTPRHCTTYAADGWFEPSQGVWQDDVSFDDKKGKQLTRLPEDHGIAYHAELNMAVNKDTLLFGVHHYRKGGEPVVVNDRNDIVLSGYSNCTVKVPVRFKFTRKNAVESHLIYLSPAVGEVPLEGAPGPEFKPWRVLLSAASGIPPEEPFRFESNLAYQLKAELVREGGGAPTGLEMTVDGYPEPSRGPKVHFVPVMLSASTQEEEDSLVRRTGDLAGDTAKYVPDLFPIAPDGLPTFIRLSRNFSDKDIPSKWLPYRRVDATVGALNDALGATTFLDGAGRVVAVMSPKDFESIFGKGYAGMTVKAGVDVKPKGDDENNSGGLPLSYKVMLMPSDETWDTVAHELLHTLPEGWSGSEMETECGRSYHNTKDPVAHGVKIDDGGRPAARRMMTSKIALMGPSVLLEKLWITQCSYWHLLKELGGQPRDPPVLMLRAWIGKKGSKVQGELKPVYDLMGYSDLSAGKGGPFAFVLEDAKGAELGRYPFTPRFSNLETGEPRELVSVVYRVPDLPGWAQVELVGPGGVLDHRARTANAPELVITAPVDSAQVKPENGKVHVTWQAQGDPGATLLYSVLYSPDGGENWLDQSFEQKETAFELRIDPKGTAHRVKIIVTDGTRSAEAVTRFVPSP